MSWLKKISINLECEDCHLAFNNGVFTINFDKALSQDEINALCKKFGTNTNYSNLVTISVWDKEKKVLSEERFHEIIRYLKTNNYISADDEKEILQSFEKQKAIKQEEVKITENEVKKALLEDEIDAYISTRSKNTNEQFSHGFRGILGSWGFTRSEKLKAAGALQEVVRTNSIAPLLTLKKENPKAFEALFNESSTNKGFGLLSATRKVFSNLDITTTNENERCLKTDIDKKSGIHKTTEYQQHKSSDTVIDIKRAEMAKQIVELQSSRTRSHTI